MVRILVTRSYWNTSRPTNSNTEYFHIPFGKLNMQMLAFVLDRVRRTLQRVLEFMGLKDRAHPPKGSFWHMWLRGRLGRVPRSGLNIVGHALHSAATLNNSNASQCAVSFQYESSDVRRFCPYSCQNCCLTSLFTMRLAPQGHPNGGSYLPITASSATELARNEKV